MGGGDVLFLPLPEHGKGGIAWEVAVNAAEVLRPIPFCHCSVGVVPEEVAIYAIFQAAYEVCLDLAGAFLYGRVGKWAAVLFVSL